VQTVDDVLASWAGDAPSDIVAPAGRAEMAP
jgi:hypothetical protein